MDYDQTSMARDYDRARSLDPDSMAAWLAAFAARVPAASNIVDLGCGTGRFTQALADFYGADVLGVDPSVTMLEQAAAKAQAGAVRFARGSAESIPAPAGSADLVFSSMAFHHFADRSRAAREIRRVLRPGGFVIIRNATRENSRRSPHARCFTGFIDVIDRHQPTQAEIVETFAPRGFVLRAHDLVFQAMAASWAELADKAALRADSNLLRLEDADFHRGLEKMRSIRLGPEERIGLDVDLFVFEAAPN